MAAKKKKSGKRAPARGIPGAVTRTDSTGRKWVLLGAPAPQRGYTPCACRDCFDVGLDGDLCGLCEAAGCDTEGECQRADAYGVEG